MAARRERWWLHVLLFAATFATTTWVGLLYAPAAIPALLDGGPGAPVARGQVFLGALQYSVPVLLILLAHEMGHYVACLRYGLDASPPYFIPLPLNVAGTFGAFIRIREPFRNRKELFDVGVAGPIAGFVMALPFLVYGILETRLHAEPLSSGAILFDYPIGLRLAQLLLRGHTFTSANCYEHPTLMAAWVGLLVTALNLLPLGQLDGGHALYALVGKRQRRVVIPLFVVLVGLGFVHFMWWIWAGILLVLGLRHPPVLDDAEPLSRGRKIVAGLVLVIFVLCFTPIPVRMSGEGSPPRRPPREGRGTLVHELHLHRRAEDAGLDARAARAEARDEAREERLGDVGLRRALEAGAPAA